MSISKDKDIQAPEAKKQIMFHGKENQTLDSPINASARFFGLPELMEMTLLHVPALRILIIQRTNKMFHDTIRSSISIQRKLFFQNDPHKEDTMQFETNPFLHHLRIRRFYGSTTKLGGNISITDLQRLNHPTASWRKMLLSMPTGNRVIMTRYTDVQLGCRSMVLFTSEKGSGVRMGHVADHAWEEEEDLWDIIGLEVKM